MLPKPWTLSESLLGCVYRGTFNGSKVRIRRVKMFSGGDTRKVKEVCTWCRVPLSSNELITFAGLPQGGRTIETLGTSQHCPSSRCHHGSSRTDFGLDARWRPPPVHQKAPRCEQTFSCGYPSATALCEVLTLYQLSDVADGLNYLHSLGVIHGDLKGVCERPRSRLPPYSRLASQTFSWTRQTEHESRTLASPWLPKT